MEVAAAEPGGSPADRRAPPYSLPPGRFSGEDILFCIDVGVESRAEMKISGAGGAGKGRPIARIHAIKQAVLFFVNAKLAMSADHRFAFSVLSHSVSWLRREFRNDVSSAFLAVQALQVADTPYNVADLTQLFRIATNEAKKSRMAGRLFRVVLIYCRSSTQPQWHWPPCPKLFTFDAAYLHDKPGPGNCPQKVYDALMDILDHFSEFEGYAFESGHGLVGVFFRQMWSLLSHPQQRCLQDDLKIPWPLVRMAAPCLSKRSCSSLPNGQSVAALLDQVLLLLFVQRQLWLTCLVDVHDVFHVVLLPSKIGAYCHTELAPFVSCNILCFCLVILLFRSC